MYDFLFNFDNFNECIREQNEKNKSWESYVRLIFVFFFLQTSWGFCTDIELLQVRIKFVNMNISKVFIDVLFFWNMLF